MSDHLCEDHFRWWAINHPEMLAAYLTATDGSHGLVARAALVAAEVEDYRVVRPALLSLLRSGVPLLQEGAVAGLMPHLDDEVRAAMQRVAADPSTSATIRDTIADALEAL